MAGCYELNQNEKGQYRFTLKAGNGEVILCRERHCFRAGQQSFRRTLRAHGSF
nr:MULTISPECIES: DUF1508 domain-containing protein [unclassified Synechococcus]